MSAIAPTTPSAVIRARDLVYEVEAARLLDRVTLTACRGELIGLIGPNGAGKSTLLRALAGLLRRRSGTAKVDGMDVERLPPKDAARRIAIVPQSAPVTLGFTSLEVVLMGRYAHLGPFEVEGREDRRIALDAMGQTETQPFAQRPLQTLSGGERQRVVLARALAQQAPVLLLDEPTSNLDVLHQLSTLELVASLVQQGATAIAAIHDLRLAARYCHRLLLLSKGRVLAEGTPEQVLTPERIQDAFGVRSVVYPDPLMGKLAISFIGPGASAPHQASGTRVHVVCGGGTGARLLYELRQAGFTVTAGVLGAGDTDRVAADILGIEYVPVPAFGAIDDAAHRRHLDLLTAARCAVLSETPFGANNVRNLEALAAAKSLVVLETGPFSPRDFSQGAAARLYDRLSPAARCRTVDEVITALQRLEQP